MHVRKFLEYPLIEDLTCWMEICTVEYISYLSKSVTCISYLRKQVVNARRGGWCQAKNIEKGPRSCFQFEEWDSSADMVRRGPAIELNRSQWAINLDLVEEHEWGLSRKVTNLKMAQLQLEDRQPGQRVTVALFFRGIYSHQPTLGISKWVSPLEGITILLLEELEMAHTYATQPVVRARQATIPSTFRHATTRIPNLWGVRSPTSCQGVHVCMEP